MNVKTFALQEHSDRLERHLAAYNLERVTVMGDGNCAFRAVLKQLEYVLHCDSSESESLKLLMISLGLLFSEDDNIGVIRSLFVKDVILQREKYISFTDLDNHEYLE